MNERINELHQQAKDFINEVSDNDGTYQGKEYPEAVREKFAELIVLEMCNVLDKEQWNIGRDWICDDGTRIIPKVKEHFGVK